MSAPPGRKTRAARLFGFGLPLGLALAGCLLMRPEAGSLLAPAFGPWAGLLYGHRDCTFASFAPVAAFALLALGAGSLVALVRLRPGARRAVALWVMGLWSVAWELTALVSVLNTTE